MAKTGYEAEVGIVADHIGQQFEGHRKVEVLAPGCKFVVLEGHSAVTAAGDDIVPELDVLDTVLEVDQLEVDIAEEFAEPEIEGQVGRETIHC